MLILLMPQKKIRFIDRRGQKIDSRYWIIELSCHFEKVLLVTVPGTGENSFRWRIFDLSGIRVESTVMHFERGILYIFIQFIVIKQWWWCTNFYCLRYFPTFYFTTAIVFRTQSNLYDGAFLRKYLTAFIKVWLSSSRNIGSLELKRFKNDMYVFVLHCLLFPCRGVRTRALVSAC